MSQRRCVAPHQVCLATCLFVATGDVIPVDDVEKVLDVFAAAVLVLQVVGVFPDVQDQQGDDAPLGQVLVLFRGEDNQRLVFGAVGQDAPATALDGGGCGLELGLSILFITTITL